MKLHVYQLLLILIFSDLFDLANYGFHLIVIFTPSFILTSFIYASVCEEASIGNCLAGYIWHSKSPHSSSFLYSDTFIHIHCTCGHYYYYYYYYYFSIFGTTSSALCGAAVSFNHFRSSVRPTRLRNCVWHYCSTELRQCWARWKGQYSIRPMEETSFEDMVYL